MDGANTRRGRVRKASIIDTTPAAAITPKRSRFCVEVMVFTESDILCAVETTDICLALPTRRDAVSLTAVKPDASSPCSSPVEDDEKLVDVVLEINDVAGNEDDVEAKTAV